MTEEKMGKYMAPGNHKLKVYLNISILLCIFLFAYPENSYSAKTINLIFCDNLISV